MDTKVRSRSSGAFSDEVAAVQFDTNEYVNADDQVTML